jgi:hypothetical protein
MHEILFLIFIHFKLELLCKSQEFKDVYLRRDEKKDLNSLNKGKKKGPPSIRFPFDGRTRTIERKVNWWAIVSLSCRSFSLLLKPVASQVGLPGRRKIRSRLPKDSQDCPSCGRM